MERLVERRTVLGDKALWGWVGYAGEPFAPVEGTYPGVDVLALAYTTVEDSGAHPRSGAALANLFPLIAAALYEAGFAYEAGPLTSWSN